MMTFERMQEIIADITYKPGWTVYCELETDPESEDFNRPFVQIGVDASTEAAIDAHLRDGTRTPWRGSKRFLSKHMCEQEIVGAAFGQIADAESHEMREWFRLKGRAIYGPHLNPYALVPVAAKLANYSIRENAMTMEAPVEVKGNDNEYRETEVETGAGLAEMGDRLPIPRRGDQEGDDGDTDGGVEGAGRSGSSDTGDQPGSAEEDIAV